MVLFDTNVLVYAAMEQDLRKRKIAADVLSVAQRDGTGAVSLQILREFANVLYKKSDIPAARIRAIVTGFAKSIPCVIDTPEMMERGMEIKARHGIQFYDALVVAAAEAAGCETIYSEDMADGAKYGSVRVENPFRQR